MQNSKGPRSSQKPPEAPCHRRNSAFTLVEVLVSLSVLLISITGVAALNSSALSLTRSAKQTTAGSLCLQERVEQLRTATWHQVTDADYLKNSLFASAPRNMAGILPATETLTISTYPDPSKAEPVKITRRANGVTILSNGATIKAESLARLDLQIQWAGKDGKPRTRESTTILSKDGISRLNLSTPTTGDTTTTTPETTPTDKTPGRGNAGGKPGAK